MNACNCCGTIIQDDDEFDAQHGLCQTCDSAPKHIPAGIIANALTIAYIGIGVVGGLNTMPNAIRDRIVEAHQGQLGVVQAALDDAAEHDIDSQECDGVHAYDVAEQFGIDFVHTEAERICGKDGAP